MRQLLLDLFGAAPAGLARDKAPTPAFAHPRANRAIVLEGTPIAYAFRRGRRRTIGLAVDAAGLTVSAPRWTPLAEVEAMLHERTRWVLRHLRAGDTERARALSERIAWGDGAQVPYLGQALTLKVERAQGRRSATAIGDGPDGPILQLRLPEHAPTEQLRELTEAWLVRQGRALFAQRLDHFAPQLGVRWQRLSLSSARTRWGSASASGAIALNWRLIHLEQALIDYVAVHELAHLHEMNHSARFWAHVQGVLPDYVERRRALRQVRLPSW